MGSSKLHSTQTSVLSDAEVALAEKALEMAREAGASACRVTLSKSVLDLVGTLDGALDKVTRCLDRSLSIALFADGRYGSFSTNRIEENALREFIGKAVETLRMLAEDPCRSLPDPSRTEKGSVRGDETATWDPEGYASVSAEWLVETALADAATGRLPVPSGLTLLSEEGELSVTASESLLLDSNGTRCRSLDTLFEYGVEVTVQVDATGEKVSGYWWDSSPWLDRLDHAGCGAVAIRRACSAAGASPAPGGKHLMAVSTECMGKLVTPLTTALGGFALWQRNSFLEGRLGQKCFSDKLTLLDEPRVRGTNGARLYDTEGVATVNGPVIEAGVVRTCFINTYIAAKLGMAPTVEDAMRPVLVPTRPGLTLGQWENEAPEGCIVVTGFNGGNHNGATGDFSYGIEGRIRRGGRWEPVKEMLITGNFLTLWNSVADILDDARPCNPKSLPSVLFENVDFSG